MTVSGGVTSSMHGHLRSKHPSVAEPHGNDSTPTMMAFVKQCAAYKRSSNLIRILAVEVRILKKNEFDIPNWISGASEVPYM